MAGCWKTVGWRKRYGGWGGGLGAAHKWLGRAAAPLRSAAAREAVRVEGGRGCFDGYRACMGSRTCLGVPSSTEGSGGGSRGTKGEARTGGEDASREGAWGRAGCMHPSLESWCEAGREGRLCAPSAAIHCAGPIAMLGCQAGAWVHAFSSMPVGQRRSAQEAAGPAALPPAPPKWLVWEGRVNVGWAGGRGSGGGLICSICREEEERSGG